MSRQQFGVVLFALALLSLVASRASAVSAMQLYQTLIPNGANVERNGVAWPGVGHNSAGGGGAVNDFGRALVASSFVWTTALCQADTDGDGFSNGAELGDPGCVWAQGAVPARRTGISHPAFADSTPVLTTPTPPPTTPTPATPLPTTPAPTTPTPTTPAPTTPTPTTATPTSTTPTSPSPTTPAPTPTTPTPTNATPPTTPTPVAPTTPTPATLTPTARPPVPVGPDRFTSALTLSGDYSVPFLSTAATVGPSPRAALAAALSADLSSLLLVAVDVTALYDGSAVATFVADAPAADAAVSRLLAAAQASPSFPAAFRAAFVAAGGTGAVTVVGVGLPVFAVVASSAGADGGSSAAPSGGFFDGVSTLAVLATAGVVGAARFAAALVVRGAQPVSDALHASANADHADHGDGDGDAVDAVEMGAMGAPSGAAVERERGSDGGGTGGPPRLLLPSLPPVAPLRSPQLTPASGSSDVPRRLLPPNRSFPPVDDLL